MANPGVNGKPGMDCRVGWPRAVAAAMAGIVLSAGAGVAAGAALSAAAASPPETGSVSTAAAEEPAPKSAASASAAEPSPKSAAAEPAAEALARRAQIDDLYTDYRRSFPEVPEMTAAELLVLPDTARVVVLDVRPPAERAVSMIPGAVTPEQLEDNPEQFRDQRIVCYCTIGYRSGRYAQQLRREGWAAENLAGSLLAWVQEGGPLVDAAGPTRRVHVYGEKWNLLPPGYEAVW